MPEWYASHLVDGEARARADRAKFRANRIGRLKNGEFSDFKVAEQNAGLSGLVVAGDGAVWFGMVRSCGWPGRGSVRNWRRSARTRRCSRAGLLFIDEFYKEIDAVQAHRATPHFQN
jgi:quinol monooxygenase YgiN